RPLNGPQPGTYTLGRHGNPFWIEDTEQVVKSLANLPHHVFVGHEQVLNGNVVTRDHMTASKLDAPYGQSFVRGVGHEQGNTQCLLAYLVNWSRTSNNEHFVRFGEPG